MILFLLLDSMTKRKSLCLIALEGIITNTILQIIHICMNAVGFVKSAEEEIAVLLMIICQLLVFCQNDANGVG